MKIQESLVINMKVFNFSFDLSIVQTNSIKDNLSENIHLLFKNSSFKVSSFWYKESNDLHEVIIKIKIFKN